MFNFVKTWLHKKTVRIEMFENKRSLWQWRIVGWNGRYLATSEEYSSWNEANDTMKMLKGKKIV